GLIDGDSGFGFAFGVRAESLLVGFGAAVETVAVVLVGLAGTAFFAGVFLADLLGVAFLAGTSGSFFAGSVVSGSVVAGSFFTGSFVSGADSGADALALAAFAGALRGRRTGFAFSSSRGGAASVNPPASDCSMAAERSRCTAPEPGTE